VADELFLPIYFNEISSSRIEISSIFRNGNEAFVHFHSRMFVKINDIFSDFCVSINNTFLSEL